MSSDALRQTQAIEYVHSTDALAVDDVRSTDVIESANKAAFFDGDTSQGQPGPVHFLAANDSQLEILPMGSAVPRIFTPPILDLSDPANTDGFAFIEWCSTRYGLTLMAHQEWLAIHLLEKHSTLVDRWRFRSGLVVCARQVGKSEFCGALVMWMAATGRAEMILSAAQKTSVAFRLIQRVHARLMRSDLGLLPAAAGRSARTMKPGLYANNADPHLELTNGVVWHLASTRNADSGRGDPVSALILDEAATLKGEDGRKIWGSLEATTTAAQYGLSLAITTPGDDESTAFNHYSDTGRANAADAAYSGSNFYAEWSAPEGCDVADPQAWAAACPALGTTITHELYENLARDTEASVFRTERLAQRVAALVPLPFTADQWNALGDTQLSLTPLKDALFVGIDASQDLGSIIAVAVAVTPTGRALMAPVKVWSGQSASSTFREEFPLLLETLSPQSWGYSAAKGAIRGLKTFLQGLPYGTPVTEPDLINASMALADEVTGRHLRHRGDSVLDTAMLGAKKHRRPDGSFVIVGRGDNDISGLYAAAIALRLARTTTTPRLQLFV